MAAGPAVRLARPDEREALIELQRRASLIWEEDRPFLLAHPDVIDVPLSQIEQGGVYVCETDGAVVGFGVVLARGDGSAELDGLFVEPRVWGQGHGRRLAAYGEGLARAMGAVSLNVAANKRALGFYEAIGFRIVGEVETQLNPGVAMVKPL